MNAGASRGRFRPTFVTVSWDGQGRRHWASQRLVRGRKDPELGELEFLPWMFINVCIISHPANWNTVPWSTNPLFLLLTWTLPQLVDVCINASYMKCQLWSIFVEYTSRALYLTDCELMSVECEIPFLKLLLSLAFFLWTVSVPGLLLHTPQASGLFDVSVMFQLVFHPKSKSLHLYCNT